MPLLYPTQIAHLYLSFRWSHPLTTPSSDLVFPNARPLLATPTGMTTPLAFAPPLQVLLCASSQTSSIVECWSLRKEGLPVNNIFQQISPVGECLALGGPCRPIQ